MTKPNSIEIIVVLDRSSSMESIKEPMMAGFDRFIDEQKHQPGECLVTLTQFDDHYDVVYTGMPIANVPKLVLEPRGMTALYDALAKTVKLTGDRLRSMRENDRPDKVLFVVITDGGENRSEVYPGPAGAAKVRAMIEHQRSKYQWEFLYLGANQDAFLVAQGLGMHHNAVTYDAHTLGAQAMFTSASAGITGYRSGEDKTKGGIISQAAYGAVLGGLQSDSGSPPPKL